MAGNKHALTRYRILDACFSNRMKNYYAEDLIAKFLVGHDRVGLDESTLRLPFSRIGREAQAGEPRPGHGAMG